MLIDKYLPEYDMHAVHSTCISGTRDTVYAALRNIDASDSPLARMLILLRTLPAYRGSKKISDPSSSNTTLDRFLKSGFILLEEKPEEEIVLGLVGKFWTMSGCIERMDANKFALFNEGGYAKAVWNFHLMQQPGGSIRLDTETRVVCTDEASRKKFLRYWFVVGPFSGLIRKEMLRTIKRRAEQHSE